MITVNALEVELTLPAASVAMAVMAWVPSGSVPASDTWMLHVPVVFVGGAPSAFVPVVRPLPISVVPAR